MRISNPRIWRKKFLYVRGTLMNTSARKRLKKNLQLAIKACQQRGEPLDHILLYGPAGLGKTTMAGVIATQMAVPMRSSSGPAIGKAADLVAFNDQFASW